MRKEMKVNAEAQEAPEITLDGQHREYTLSEAGCGELGRAFALIAHLAPTLGEAELRVLIALTRLFASNPHKSGRISSRQLAEISHTERKNVKNALASLGEKHLIASRAGTATAPSGHVLTFLRTAVMGGVAATPPPKTQQLLVGFSQPQGGVFSTPPSTATEGHAGAGASIDSISTDTIDRLLKANPKKCDPIELRELRRWVHGYQAKFGRDKEPHPPDDTILAQLLALAPLYQIVKLIENLSAERKEPGYQYAWYVTVAMQRIHGIAPTVLKTRRAELRIEPKKHKAITGEQEQFPASEETTDPGFHDEIMGIVQQRDPAICHTCNGQKQLGLGANKSNCGHCRGTGRESASRPRSAGGAA